MILAVLYDVDIIMVNGPYFHKSIVRSIPNIIIFITQHERKMISASFSKGAKGGESPMVNPMIISNDFIK